MASFTVCICTRNRAAMLEACLNALIESLVDKSVTILVIDNASTDQTPDILSSRSVHIRVLNEPKVGLSNARNRALAECTTEYLVFLDDDGIPDPGWIAAIEEITRKGTADVFGGPYSPYYTDPKPDWFSDKLGSAHFDLSDGPQKPLTCFSGGNMGWRAALLRDFGGFDPALGMVDGRLGLGEETALQLAIWNARPEAIFEFSRTMHMRHHVPASKMRLRYIHRRNFIYGKQLKDIDLSEFKKVMAFHHFARCSKLGFPLLARMLHRDRQKYPHWQSYAAAYLSLNSILLGVQMRRLLDLLKA